MYLYLPSDAETLYYYKLIFRMHFCMKRKTVDFLTHLCRAWFRTDFLSDRSKTQIDIDDISVPKLNKTACWSSHDTGKCEDTSAHELS